MDIRLCSHPLFVDETRFFQSVIAILFARMFAAIKTTRLAHVRSCEHRLAHDEFQNASRSEADMTAILNDWRRPEATVAAAGPTDVNHSPLRESPVSWIMLSRILLGHPANVGLGISTVGFLLGLRGSHAFRPKVTRFSTLPNCTVRRALGGASCANRASTCGNCKII